MCNENPIQTLDLCNSSCKDTYGTNGLYSTILSAMMKNEVTSGE